MFFAFLRLLLYRSQNKLMPVIIMFDYVVNLLFNIFAA